MCKQVKATFSLDTDVIEKINQLSQETSLNKSKLLRLLINSADSNETIIKFKEATKSNG